MITESEIQEIIDRVRRKLGDAGEQVGSGLRGAAELEAISAVELGDGIHATVDEAVAAAKCAYNTFRGAGLE
ncbi:MAG TPA: hypothetical protein ENH33_08320, partial [Actinobacteria bacterium]|nr:hypothetical protein [Actinomycetota bacterium]